MGQALWLFTIKKHKRTHIHMYMYYLCICLFVFDSDFKHLSTGLLWIYVVYPVAVSCKNVVA